MNGPVHFRQRQGAIGVFDSGVGGLSVLQALQDNLPQEQFVYCADQAYVPYGERPLADVVARCHTLVRFLLDQDDVKLIVVACNTATALAIETLRTSYPHIAFVGVEPAIKPAICQTKSGVVGVLATESTLRSARYRLLCQRFAQRVQVVESPCHGLVTQIERGLLDTAEMKALLERFIRPMLMIKIDVLILGCTHYPFVQPLIEKITGQDVSILNPAEAVARRAISLLPHDGLSIGRGRSGVRFFTTGVPERFQKQVQQLLDITAKVQPIPDDYFCLSDPKRV